MCSFGKFNEDELNVLGFRNKLINVVEKYHQTQNGKIFCKWWIKTASVKNTHCVLQLKIVNYCTTLSTDSNMFVIDISRKWLMTLGFICCFMMNANPFLGLTMKSMNGTRTWHTF